MIKPVGKYIQIELSAIKSVGDLVTGSKKTIHEWGKVLAIGDEVTLKINVGDTILVKGWSIDTVTKDKEEYAFVSEDSGGICAIIND